MMNHLWQSTIFALAIALLTLALRKNRASIRHWLWFAASIKFLIPLTLLTSLGRQAPPSASQLVQPIATAAGQLTAPFPEPIEFTAAARPESFDWMPWLLAAWACGFLAIALMRFRGWLRIRALIRASTPASLQLPVETRFTSGLLGPGIVGIWKPVLLLPAGIEQHLTPEQFNTAIAHELCHVRRRDNLLAAIHMCVEAIFWFHPLVWWIGTRLVEERELACDEAVLAQGGNPRDYAEAILGVCKHYVEAPLACVCGVTGADIKKRLEAILTGGNILSLDWSRKLLLTSAALVAATIPFLAGIATAQSSKPFEGVYIRLADPQGPRVGAIETEFGNGRFAISNVVYNLIADAFRVHSCAGALQGYVCPYLTGEPSWIKEDIYNIRATLPPGTPSYSIHDYIDGEATAIYPMIESLLHDRFHLKTHRETREVPVYILTVAGNGHKMKPSTGDAGVLLPDPSLRGRGRFGIKPVEGSNGMSNIRLTAANYTVQRVADRLAQITSVPVLNHTNLKGRFDFTVDYPAGPNLVNRPGSLADYITPELFVALQEQAGLRLESAKEKIDVVVIDSIERPSEN